MSRRCSPNRGIERGVLLARAADALTLARAMLAVALAGAVAAHRMDVAAWLLAAAWCSDAGDGRLARAAEKPTRLGGFDLPIDTAVGAGLLVGMALSGHVPVLVAAGLIIVLGGGFLALGNAALSMALQAVAYASFLVALWSAAPVARWVPLSVIAVLFVVELRRLLTVVIPAFLTDLAALARPRRRE
jgi:phosphatidylglycerophosphate synthase